MHHRPGHSSGPAGNMPEEDALGAAYHSHWQQQEEARRRHRHYRRQPQQQQYVCYYVPPDTVHHGEEAPTPPQATPRSPLPPAERGVDGEASAAEEGERGASAGYYYDHAAGAYCYYHPRLGTYYYDAAQQVWRKAAVLIDSDDDGDSRYHKALASHPYASTAHNSGHRQRPGPGHAGAAGSGGGEEGKAAEEKEEPKEEDAGGSSGLKAVIRGLTGGLDFHTASKIGFIAFIAYMVTKKKVRGMKSAVGVITAVLLSFDVLRTLRALKAGRQQEGRGFSTRDRLGGRAAAASASKKGGKSYFAELMDHIMAHAIMIGARRGLGANNPSSWGGFADDRILKKALFTLFDQHRKLLTFGGRSGADAAAAPHLAPRGQPQARGEDGGLQDLLREALQMYTSGLTGTGGDGGSVLGTTLASLAGGSELAEGERSMRLIVSAVDRALGYYKERGGKRRHLLMVVGAVVLVGIVLLFRRRRVGPVLVHQ